MKPRLAVITTHPIQYYAPLFRTLTERGSVELHVFYGWEGATRPVLDRGFGQVVQWDIPLLDGYDFTFVPNESREPGTHHFRGIVSRELVSVVRAWQPDAVLVFGWSYQSHLEALRAFHGHVPVFFRGDSTLLDEHSGFRRLARRMLLRWVYKYVDVAFYVGANNRRYFEQHGFKADQLAWAPHAIDNERFLDADGTCESKATDWRRKLGIAEDDRVVLFCGKLEPKKAPELLLKAFLERDDPDEHLVFVGTGPLETLLRSQAEGRSNIHFLGFQNQSRMPVVYRLCDVFVLPSNGPGETWGLAVNEAMASGRPVIVSDRVGCAPDLVQPDETGYVFPSGDVDGLIAALDNLVLQPESRLRMGCAAQKLVQAWSIEEAARRMEDVILDRCGTYGRNVPVAKTDVAKPKAHAAR